MPVVGPASEYLQAKTCPLLASSTASTSPEYERAGAARASRVEFFDSGMPAPAESARAVAAAMRMPVKVPGPTPASTRSTEPRPSPARSRTACTAGGDRSRGRPWSPASRRRGPGSARRQALRGGPTEADAPCGRGVVVDVDDRGVLDGAERGIRPLYERHGVGFYVVVELEYVAVFDPLQTIEVHVVDGHALPVLTPFVAAGELVGRARYPVGDAERTGGGPDEGRLAGADLSGEHHVL